eukprot:gene1530-1693_t
MAATSSLRNGNEVRSFIRSNARKTNNVLTSLQECRLEDNLEVLESKIQKLSAGSKLWEHLRGLRAVLDSLLSNVFHGDGSVTVNSFMDFDEAFQLYLAYCTDGSKYMNDGDHKKRFKELLLHPNFGLCVYVATFFNEKQFVVLRPDGFDLEDFFSILLEKDPVLLGNRVELNKDNVKKLYGTLDSEWDKRVVRVILGATRTRSQLDEIGIDSDLILSDKEAVFKYIQEQEKIEEESERIVCEEINKKIVSKEKILDEKIKLCAGKANMWGKEQLEEGEQEIAELRSTIKCLGKLRNESSQRKARMLKWCKSNLIRNRRLKLRKIGSGRKHGMDAVDEKFLTDCIMSKSTAHGRRHDSVMYLNHRVKKKDFLNIVNISRANRGLSTIKSATTAWNRSRPKNMRSLQAKNHIGLGLFCCKKPPKAEDHDNLLVHFCRAHKKNIIRALSGQNSTCKNVLYRSFDDKAYLCPGTSTGMTSSRSQKVFQPDDAELARKLTKYDFPLCMVNCTPGTFLFMNKNVAVVDGEESIQTSDQQTVVITKPKYFVSRG